MEEMNQVMISRWNSRVKSEDIIFHLGDLGFGYAPKESPDAPKHAHKTILEQLNGHIILVRGNHDGNNEGKTIIESLVIRQGGYKMFLTHNPHYANPHYEINLCGHLHGKNGKVFKLSGKSLVVDLSVELWNYAPVNINEILKAVQEFKKKG
jgi:calcineurin-like phosphoesterase family protein